MRRAGVALGLALAATARPADAAERRFTVTGFEKIRVEGPYAVAVVTGTAPAARAEGDQHALDALAIEVRDRTLVIRRASGWGGDPGAGTARIAVATHDLSAASLSGAGSLAIDAMRGGRVALAVIGAGTARLAAVQADRLDLAIDGGGVLEAAGKAADVHVAVRGPGTVRATGLVAEDGDILANGAGDVALTITRTAKVTASGTGNVTIAGDPACTISALGSGAVICGHPAR